MDDKTIALAREAGLHLPYWDEDQDPKKEPPRWTMVSPLPPLLERFAALVQDDYKNRLAAAIEEMPFGDTASSFATFVRNFK